MIVQQLVISEVKLILPTYFEDYRGYYCESYSKRTLEEHGINDEFIQDNHFFSLKRGTVRGIHFQNNPYAQAKLVRCTKGSMIDAIAVTYGPGLVGALLIGVSAAKAASMATGIPLIGVDHIMGHIMAAQLKDEIEYPALALQVSGGHTEIVLMKDPIHFEIVGDTRDDAAGEAYDKIGRVLGVNYPAGKTIDEWAHKGKDTFHFPRAMMEDDDYDFSFSGLKSAFINTCHHADQIHKELDKYDLAASFQASVVDVLSHKTIRAIKEYKPKTFILGGGVAANHGLRDRLAEEIEKLPADIKPKVILPDLKLCGSLWCSCL